MKSEDKKVILNEIEKMLPELSEVKPMTDPITGKLFFVGTTEDNRIARFEVSAKITQIGKQIKLKEA